MTTWEDCTRHEGAWEIYIGDDTWELVSYERTVARLERDRNSGGLKLVRLWRGYTEMHHVNAWLMRHGMKPICKEQWMEMEVCE